VPSGAPLPSDPIRVVIGDVFPSVDGGRFPAKAVANDPVTVVADVFSDGHDLVAAAVVWEDDDGPTEVPLVPLVNDRFEGSFTPARPGDVTFRVTGWMDRFGTWRKGALAKIGAGLNVALELREGAELVADAATRAEGDVAARLAEVAERLWDGDAKDVHRDGTAFDALDVAMWQHGDRRPAVESDAYRLIVDRPRAAFSAWYELFPRSWGEAGEHGTFRSVVERLDYVAEMGFDVLYLPPVHPIGEVHRKGKENATLAAADDVGSPWAIGSELGGHTTIHPQLGTLDDFHELRRRADQLGLELALDIAFQCAPDHPWAKEHPEWFKHRADGTIAHAENPPKKYEDIYPIDFESSDWPALWEALAGVFRFWMDQGVRIFRVDNPHTKAFRFWDWVIATLRAEDPGVIFLAEAFTRPRVMERLAKGGFTQSYTYFTWRPSAFELREYLTELTSRPLVDYFRPNFWPNTPDILTEQLQEGGPATFRARAVLAATLSSNWGVYGPAFELMEHEPRGTVEEYARNEKYEIRSWDLEAPGSLAPLLGRLNATRRAHPALQRTTGLTFHDASNPALLCYSKATPDGEDVVLCIVNCDSDVHHSGWVHLDLEALHVEAARPFEVADLVTGAAYTWHGADNFVILDPTVFPAHVLKVEQ
jgi:starch synthase (maltosyl-transferring)